VLNLSPQELAQLPFAAFLILLGSTVFTLGWRQVWVWGREKTDAQKERDEWKAVATKMTDTNIVQANQITQLTQSVALLTDLVKDRTQ
jgi:hypothetical protein